MYVQLKKSTSYSQYYRLCLLHWSIIKRCHQEDKIFSTIGLTFDLTCLILWEWRLYIVHVNEPKSLSRGQVRKPLFQSPLNPLHPYDTLMTGVLNPFWYSICVWTAWYTWPMQCMRKHIQKAELVQISTTERKQLVDDIKKTYNIIAGGILAARPGLNEI